MISPQKERTQPGGAGSLDALTGSAGEIKDTRLLVDLEQARLQLAVLDGAGAVYEFRALHPVHRPYSVTGTLDDVADQLIAANEQGYGIFVVINAGGRKKEDIDRIRAVFADVDNAEAWKRILDNPGALKVAGRDPHLIVETSPGKGHVYWKAKGLRTEDFGPVQKAIAAHYGADPSVADLSRVMRVPGFLHTKGTPQATSIVDARPTDVAFDAEEILAAFAPASPPPDAPATAGLIFSPLSQFGQFGDSGVVVSDQRHADILVLTGQQARKVVFEGLSRDAALSLLFYERERGRWTRDVPDQEIIAALDQGIEKCRAGLWRETVAANDPAIPEFTSLAESLARELTPFTDEDYARAAEPHPHVFADGKAGMFPVGEVTTLAAPGREGKTTATTFIVSRAALGWSIAGLASRPVRVVIYSNEDDRIQYARKTLALRSQLPADESNRVHNAVIVPNLEAPALIQWRALVQLTEKRRPVQTAMVDAIIEAIRPSTAGEDPVGIIVFETASTLSEADEDNPGLKALTAAAKRVARQLNVAVILVHHTNQTAGETYKGLNFSVADMRGGTVLPYNSRQCLLLVNLGGDEEPLAAKDARTPLRKFVLGELDGSGIHAARGLRISALLPLDTSKAANPPPAFFAWIDTQFGPTVYEISPPDEYVGFKWPRLRQALLDKIKLLNDAKKEARTQRTDAESQKNRAMCLDTVRDLEAEGKPPTVKSVSVRLNKSNDWAKPYLAAAVDNGELVRAKEKIPHTKGEYDVYRFVREGD